jgi:hypothetical protein
MQKDVYAAFQIINSKLNWIIKTIGVDVMAEFDALSEQVTRLESAADLVVTKLQALIDQGTVDPAAVEALTNRLKAIGDKLEAAAS